MMVSQEMCLFFYNVLLYFDFQSGLILHSHFSESSVKGRHQRANYGCTDLLQEERGHIWAAGAGGKGSQHGVASTAGSTGTSRGELWVGLCSCFLLRGLYFSAALSSLETCVYVRHI